VTDSFNSAGTVYKVEVYDSGRDQGTQIFTFAATEAGAERKAVNGYCNHYGTVKSKVEVQIVETHDAEIAV